MKRPIFLSMVASVAVVCMLAGCHHAPKSKPLSQLTPTEMQGHQIFQQNCSVCHHADSTQLLKGPGLQGLFQKPYLPSGAPATDERGSLHRSSWTQYHAAVCEYSQRSATERSAGLSAHHLNQPSAMIRVGNHPPIACCVAAGTGREILTSRPLHRCSSPSHSPSLSTRRDVTPRNARPQ